jgi:glycosyltransferase involved in cell wall biosynthesis
METIPRKSTRRSPAAMAASAMTGDRVTNTSADEAASPIANPSIEAGQDATPLDVTVILPAYNEEEALADDLADVRAAMDTQKRSYEIMVVDDGSRDRTAEVAEGIEWVRLERHPFNRGTGAARTTGIKAARGEIIVFTDADRTYPNDRIPEMLDMMDSGADMIIGARRVEAGTMRWLRTPAKLFLRKLAEYMTGSRIPDLNSGLRAQRKNATMRFLPILPTTHSWVSTITIAFLASGYVVRWLPIDYYARVGSSTFHPLRDSYNYLSLIVRTVMYFNPLKIFLPVSLALLGIGTLKYILIDVFSLYGRLIWPIPPMRSVTTAVLFTGLQVLVIGLLADLIVKRTKL